MKIRFLLVCLIFLSSTVKANNFFHPKASPDGQHVAFYGYVNKVPDIFILDMTNHKITQFTKTKSNWEIEPRWLNNHTISYASGKDMRHLKMVKTSITQLNEQDFAQFESMQFPVGPESDKGVLLMNRKKSDGWQIQSVGDQTIGQNFISGWIGHQINWHRKQVLVTDGFKIHFTSLNGNSTETLYESNNPLSFPSWHESDNLLLFIKKVEGKSDIWAKDMLTDSVIQITKDGLVKYSPQWLRKKRWIIVAKQVGDVIDIVALNEKGELVTNFTKALR